MTHQQRKNTGSEIRLVEVFAGDEPNGKQVLQCVPKEVAVLHLGLCEMGPIGQHDFSKDGEKIPSNSNT